MSIQELINVVKEAAPLVASMVGSVSPMAGLVLDGVGHLFGVTTSNPADIAAAISADPDAKIKLQEFELKHSEALKGYDTEDYGYEVNDRVDARKRDEEIIKSGKTDWVLSGIAILVVLGFFILCGLNYFFPVRDDHVLIMLIGQVSSGFLLVLSFYFGSSKKQ